MRQLPFIALIFSALFFSCEEKVTEEKSEQIPATIQLEAKKSGIHVLGIPKVKTYKGNLVILNPKDTLLFKVYNSDFEFLTGYGQLEEFPLELKFPVFCSPVISEELEYVSIYDLANVNSIKLRPNLKDQKGPWDYENVKLKGLDLYPMTLLYTSDSTAVYVPEMGGSIAIDFTDSRTGEVKPYHFKEFEKIKPSNLSYVFQSVGAVNLKKELLLIAPIMTGELEFYDLQGKLIKTVPYDTTNLQGNMLREANFIDTNLTINAIDLSISENFIYLLSSNNKLNEAVTGKKTNNSSIYQFDWNGQLIQKYELGVDANSFGVDEKLKRFYVTLNENDDEPIWYFEF